MEELKERLRQAAAEAAKKRSKVSKEEEEDEDVLFGTAYLRLKGERDKDNPSSSSSSCLIPRFFSVPPAEGDALGHKLREEARAEFLQRRSRSLLDNEELKGLWALLDAHAESSSSSSSSTDSPPEQVRRRRRKRSKLFSCSDYEV